MAQEETDIEDIQIATFNIAMSSILICESLCLL